MQHHKAENALESKLPDVGTTIFTTMSKMAFDHKAINLSQGYPDFPVAEELVERISFYMKKDFNQYAPMPGMPSLLKAISEKLDVTFGLKVESEQEVTVTAGATEALFCVFAALVQSGDEVIILDPAYDSYVPATVLQGGKPVRIPLKSGTFRPDFEAISKAISPRTRLLVLNTPHNPTGAVWQEEDMLQLQELVKKHEQLWVLSDEVYEHLTYDGEEHQSVLRYPYLRERSAAVYSFGKTFHATGWKIGYVVAPPALTREVKKVHQYVTFSVHTPTQMALADYLKDPGHYQELPNFYQQKRDLFQGLMENSRFRSFQCSGTYFQLYSYAGISDMPELEMAKWLTAEHGVAAIPVSVFYEKGLNQQLLRFCFAKNEETLTQAAKILCRI